MIPDILKSKKGQAFLAGVILLVCKDLIGLSPEDAEKIVGLVMAYVVGQGISDHGKEAAKIAPPKP